MKSESHAVRKGTEESRSKIIEKDSNLMSFNGKCASLFLSKGVVFYFNFPVERHLNSPSVMASHNEATISTEADNSHRTARWSDLVSV